MKGRILCCLKTGADAVQDQLGHLPLPERQARIALDNAVVSIRQMSEWGNRGLKGPFARLYMPQDEVRVEYYV